MPYPDCTGAIEECLNCPCSDCKKDCVPSPIRVDDFVKGENIFERSEERKKEQKRRAKHDYYMKNHEKNLQYARECRRKKKSALLSGN